MSKTISVSEIRKKIDLGERLQKKLYDISSFNNLFNNKKERITYIRDKNDESKKKYKNYKTLTTILKSFNTFVIIATTSISIT